MKIATVLKPVSKHVICKPVVHQLVICQQSLIHFISISRQDKTRNSCSKNYQSTNWRSYIAQIPYRKIEFHWRQTKSIEGRKIPLEKNKFHWGKTNSIEGIEFDWEKTNSIEGNKFHTLTWTLTAKFNAVNTLINSDQLEGQIWNPTMTIDYVRI